MIQRLIDELFEFLPFDEPVVRDDQIHNIPFLYRKGNFLKLKSIITRSIKTSDSATDTCPDDHMNRNFVRFEDLEDSDMSEPL